MSFILASSSISRRTLLENAGVCFEVDPADIDEGAVKNAFQGDCAALALELAERKALAVSERRSGLVLGADQVLEFQGRVYDKARSVQEARARLIQLRGQAHYLQGGVVAARKGDIIWRHQTRCEMVMRNFSDVFLDRYMVESRDILTASVGCYGYEGLGVQLFKCVEGDYFAVLGLPLLPVLEMLRSEGALTI